MKHKEFKELEKAADFFIAAVDAGVPKAVATSVITTSHKGRLTSLFAEASARMLDSYRAHKATGALFEKRQSRVMKALVDLCLARMRMIGCERPSVQECVEMVNSIKRAKTQKPKESEKTEPPAANDDSAKDLNATNISLEKCLDLVLAA